MKSRDAVGMMMMMITVMRMVWKCYSSPEKSKTKINKESKHIKHISQVWYMITSAPQRLISEWMEQLGSFNKLEKTNKNSIVFW